MKHILSTADEKIDDQLFLLYEIANTDKTTVWSDGTTGEMPQRDPGAKPVESFYVTFEIQMTPYISPPYSQSTLTFGYGGIDKATLKEKLMKLIMKF